MFARNEDVNRYMQTDSTTCYLFMSEHKLKIKWRKEGWANNIRGWRNRELWRVRSSVWPLWPCLISMYASMSHGRRAIAYPRGRISYLPNVGSRPGRHVYPEHFGWSNSSRYTPSRDALNIDALFNLFEYGNVPAREPNATRPSSTTTPASELHMRGASCLTYITSILHWALFSF